MAIEEALRRPELGAGFVWGAVIGGPVAVVAFASTRIGRRRQRWGMAGAVTVVASVAALASLGDQPEVVLLTGVILLGLAGFVPLPWRVPALAPGAVAVAAATPMALPAWARAAVVVGSMVAGVTGPLMDRRHRPGVGPALLAGSAVGAWACVPDVEQAGVVAGAAVSVALLSLLASLRLGAGGASAATGLLLWAAASGAIGRPAALVGAAAGLGLLVVGVVALPRSPSLRAGLGAVAGQALVVAVTSRVAGLQTSPLAAAGIAFGTLLVAGVAARLLSCRTPRGPRRRQAARTGEGRWRP